VFGELGWVPNFSVKNSKNNTHRHTGAKEFFDRPKKYEMEFHKGAQTAENFFKMR
jgi:hypothetical protein